MSKTNLQKSISLIMEKDDDDEIADNRSSQTSLESENQNFAQSVSEKFEDVEASFDTDLELEEEKPDFDATGRSLYLSVCTHLGVVPASYFLRHMQDSVLKMRYHGLGNTGAQALSYPLQNNTTVLTLDLQGNWLEGEGAEYIANMLKENCYIRELDLSRNRLGHLGAVAVCDMLTVNTTLESLDLAGNQFTDFDAPCFAEALHENSTLKSLNLNENEFGEKSGRILGQAVGENESIEKLSLSWNLFRRKSVLKLCEGIAVNCRLIEVNLSMNGFDNEGALGVADIIKKNHTIQTLDISYNRIGWTGALVIGKALEKNDVLKQFKIAYNPIGVEGAKAILKGIDNGVSIITSLDLAGIEVDKEFREMEEKLFREGRVVRGQVLSDYIIKLKPRPDKYLFSKPLSELTKENILPAIKQYCADKEISLSQAITTLNKRKDFRLPIPDFLSALKMAGVELSEKQRTNLSNVLQGLVSDNVIDFKLLK